MLVPVYDIVNCGPRSRFVANGKLVHNSKGSAINMQNLKRGSFLRKAIMAPEGYQLAVGDLSQIEPRVLAWLADYEDMLLIFQQGGDPYAAFGAQMFNIPGMTKESHPDLRQSAKSALLGCFGPDTLVLTCNGWKPIVQVQATDTVWDGEEWVRHQGVVPQGEKEVLTALGVSATSDHEILTERGWVEWSAVLADLSLLKPATFPATFGSSAAASTWPTNDASLPGKSKRSSSESQPLKQRMQTFDIAYAGPRNRYTILTSEGPLIVHNCGYGLGWASFAAQLLVGFLGAPPVRYDRDFAKKLGVSSTYIQSFLERPENIERMLEIPHTCTDEELLVHCVAAKKIIDKYRATAHPVVGFWAMCDSLIQRSLADGEEFVYKCLTFRKEEIILPNGMPIRYNNLRQEKDKETKTVSWVYDTLKNGRTVPVKLYGGKITNNVVQGTARIVMTDGMLRVAKRYPIAGTVHDELIAVVPDEEVDAAKTWVLAQMTMEPKYMPGIPLAADGGVHRRYGLAKN